MAPTPALIEITVETWSKIDDRRSQLTDIDEAFHEYLSGLVESANLSVDKYQSFLDAHTRWRRILIVGTGFVAVLNLLAANKDIVGYSAGSLPVLAAVAAVLLTVLANLESQGNCLDSAQGFRESRELFLDAARDFDRMWNTYVIPLGDSPEACFNAFELYRQIVEKDKELRAKFKELTKTKTKQPQ